jgi:ribosomal protein S6
LKEIDGHLADAKTQLLFKDPWSKRGLAYKIGGFDEAKFVMYYVEMDPAHVRELDHQLRLQKGILRHMMVIPPKGYEAVSHEAVYQDWLKNRETVADVRQRKKEEKLTAQVTANAKRASKSAAAAKKETAAAPVKPLQMEKLTSELDKLISDEDLKI